MEKVYQNKQIQLMETLKTIVTNKFKDSFIEKCLMNLEGKYYEKDGLRIIESLIGSILNGKSFSA